MACKKSSTETMELKLDQPKEVINDLVQDNNNNNPKNKTLLFLESISSLFIKNKSKIGIDYENGDSDIDKKGTPLQPLPISELSPFANSVISRCAEILKTSAKLLQNRFDTEMPDNIRQPSSYAKNFLEFCSYHALYLVTTSRSDYLNDQEFLRLTFDMMIAWEAPGVDTEILDNGMVSPCNSEEDGLSLFYFSTTKMAVQVDNAKTVGPDAFARIAPACSVIADISTVNNLFDALTSSSGRRLHFLIYSKYLRSLEKVIKVVQSGAGAHTSNLSLVDNEIILDIAGTVPIQPVLQHVGISTWPGRLTLTNSALYYESGVGLYDRAVRYDLATDIKQTIKPELTGPLGVRLFDRAVMYKSTSTPEPVFLEFPEFKGSSRRDYWLDISLEILRVHQFMRKYNLKEIQKFEALSRAILGVVKYRALREGLNISSTNYKTVLCFNLAESLPRGDLILETLSRRLALMNPSATHLDSVGSPNSKTQLSPIALLTLSSLGIKICTRPDMNGDATVFVGDVSVGESNPLETAVIQSKQYSGKAEAAQESVERVKVEGIDSNLAVLKELFLPFIKLLSQLQILVSWRSPFKSLVFMVVVVYIIVREWIRHIFPSILVYVAVIMLWRQYTETGKRLEVFKVMPPSRKNPVELLLMLQDAMTQGEAVLQNSNIILLKLRALLYAVVPQASYYDNVRYFMLILVPATEKEQEEEQLEQGSSEQEKVPESPIRENLLLSDTLVMNTQEPEAETMSKTEGTVGEEVGQVDTEVEEGQIQEEWLTVDPSKASRSPSKKKILQYGQVEIISPSRFSALSKSDENEDMLDRTEEEINEVLMDTESNVEDQTENVSRENKLQIREEEGTSKQILSEEVGISTAGEAV